MLAGQVGIHINRIRRHPDTRLVSRFFHRFCYKPHPAGEGISRCPVPPVAVGPAVIDQEHVKGHPVILQSTDVIHKKRFIIITPVKIPGAENRGRRIYWSLNAVIFTDPVCENTDQLIGISSRFQKDPLACSFTPGWYSYAVEFTFGRQRRKGSLIFASFKMQ